MDFHSNYYILRRLQGRILAILGLQSFRRRLSSTEGTDRGPFRFY